MNTTDQKYNKFALVREMMETPAIVRNFKHDDIHRFAKRIRAKKGLLLTGEGSSRIFPAKRAIYSLLKSGFSFPVVTEGSTQACEYPLSDHAVFAASNSGQTKEVIRLVSTLKKRNHDAIFGLTANNNTKLQELVDDTHILACGKEDAVAATKSVIEQGLFYDALFRSMEGVEINGLREAGDKIEQALTMPIDKAIIDKIKAAEVIYFAGRNNGVAEELALKTNEITRKKSAYLEGTFAVHGIEEVMDKNEVVIWIEPFQEEVDKFNECLVKGVGMNVIAISCSNTIFPQMHIPYGGQYCEYVQLAAGWNILVETGIALGIDLDKPVRARKVGNEFTGK
ncbi:MAG TPA: SIS domain-containing protein [Bacteroidales bacterium]|nr:SIS domain-containing protein [Bacteroidales bacterium]